MAEPSAIVYSWYMPEVRHLAEDFAQYEYGEVTKTLRQSYDPGLDNLHLPLMERFENSLDTVLDPQSLSTIHSWHKYYTNGSSEGIFHLLVRHKVWFPNVPLYQWAGEYQGYGEYAKTLGLSVQDVQYGENIGKLPPGVFLISVPSAVDGNMIASVNMEPHYVILDLAYANMTPQITAMAIHSRVAAIVASMSKPFGMYYYRVGFLWSRDPVPSLYGNRWFKNAHSIKLAELVLNNFQARDLAEKYRSWQERACADASEHLGVAIKPSNVWLLGHVPLSTDPVPDSLLPFKRGPGYRLCLTPYYMEYDEQHPN